MMVRRALLLALIVIAARVSGAAAQARPDCTEVLREMHRHHGTPDADRIALRLDTDPKWVKKCATTFGRRVKLKPDKPTEDDQELTAKVEEREYEETAREEAGQQANIVQGDLDNYKDRDRVRGIDPDSSAEWEPYLTHEWEPYVGHQWEPYILDDDHPNEE